MPQRPVATPRPAPLINARNEPRGSFLFVQRVFRECFLKYRLFVMYSLYLECQTNQYNDGRKRRKMLEEKSECRYIFKKIHRMAHETIGSFGHHRSRFCHNAEGRSK